MAYSPDGQALAAGDTGGVGYVWNLATGNGVTLPDPDSMGIESVAFGPGSQWLATGDTNGHTYVWQSARHQAGEDADQPDERVRAAAHRGLLGGVQPEGHPRHHRPGRPRVPMGGALQPG